MSLLKTRNRPGGNRGPSPEGMQEHFQKRNKYADRLIEKWDKNKSIGAGIGSTLYNRYPERARNVAIALENQERHLDLIGEAVISQDFKVKPENVLRIIRLGAANSNRQDIFTEWSCVGLDDAVYFIERTREKTKRGAMAGDNLYEVMSPDYPTDRELVSLGSVNGSETNFAVAGCPVLPIVPFTVKIICAGKLIGADNGTGGLIGTNVNSSNSTINYGTGAVTLVFTEAPTSDVIGGSNLSIEYSWDTEKDETWDEWGTVSLKVAKRRFNCTIKPLGYRYSRLAQEALSSSGLVSNIDDTFLASIADEHAMSKDYASFRLAKRIALTNPVVHFDCDFADQGSEDHESWAQRTTEYIDYVSGRLYDDCKKGEVNNIISGSQALPYLKKNKLWKTDESQPRIGASYLAGTLDGKKVWTCPSDVSTIGADEAILTYKNPSNDGDISIAYGVRNEISSALEYPEFYKVGNVGRIESEMVINSKYIRMMKFDNLPNIAA